MGDAVAGLPGYLEKECEYLRTRLAVNIDETGALERHAIVATGVLWAWLATHQVVAGLSALAWLPLAVTLFFGFRAVAVYYRVQSVRTYLAKLEAAADLPGGLGWATSLELSGGRYRLWTANASLGWDSTSMWALTITSASKKPPLNFPLAFPPSGSSRVCAPARRPWKRVYRSQPSSFA